MMNALNNLLRPTAESQEQARSKLLRSQSDLTRIELRSIEKLRQELVIAGRSIGDILEDLPRLVSEARARAVRGLVAGIGGNPTPLEPVHDLVACDWLASHLAEVEGFLRTALIVARQQQLDALEQKHAPLLRELGQIG